MKKYKYLLVLAIICVVIAVIMFISGKTIYLWGSILIKGILFFAWYKFRTKRQIYHFRNLKNRILLEIRVLLPNKKDAYFMKIEIPAENYKEYTIKCPMKKFGNQIPLEGEVYEKIGNCLEVII